MKYLVLVGNVHIKHTYPYPVQSLAYGHNSPQSYSALNKDVRMCRHFKLVKLNLPSLL